MIVLFLRVDARLNLVFFFSSYKLAIIVDHAAKGILLPNLFDLICQILDLGSRLINILSQSLTSSILLLKESSVLLHGLILAVALTEHIEGLCSISQVFQAALDRTIYKCLCISVSTIKATLHLVSCLCSLLVKLEVHSLLFDRLVGCGVATPSSSTGHHLEERRLVRLLLLLILLG